MHFTTLYLLKGEEIENTSLYEIEEDFANRYCYSCGETRPMYRYWCDWFQIGGRWCDLLKASNGIIGEKSLLIEHQPKQHFFSIANISDLEQDIDGECIYAIATKSRIYTSDSEKYKQLLSKINSKQIKGVVALIDCHD